MSVETKQGYVKLIQMHHLEQDQKYRERLDCFKERRDLVEELNNNSIQILEELEGVTARVADIEDQLRSSRRAALQI